MSPEQGNFLENLFRSYIRKLTLYAEAKLQDPNRAQEVVQDAFQEAILHIDTLSDHPNPGGWLMQTVKYKIQESERARRRYMLRFLSMDTELSAELIPSGELIPDLPEANGVSPIEKIQKALAPEELQLLKRLIFDGASHLEVSQELGITVWTSQKRLERIRKKLFEFFPERKNKK